MEEKDIKEREEEKVRGGELEKEKKDRAHAEKEEAKAEQKQEEEEEGYLVEEKLSHQLPERWEWITKEDPWMGVLVQLKLPQGEARGHQTLRKPSFWGKRERKDCCQR